jgi:exodeoxyribonuclease-3
MLFFGRTVGCTMKIASWNVNSLKVRLQHVLDWLAAAQPDCLCLQELKLEDANFPAEALTAAGYHAVHLGQKTYNGVAILSRTPPSDLVHNIPPFDDEHKRVISATVGDVRVVSAYVPNGQAVGSEKYEYKLKWLRAFAEWLAGEVHQYPRLAVVGDFNIAPEDRDVHDPKLWQGQIMCSDAEREAFRRLLGLGLRDSFRLFEQPEKSYTWWDYRMNAFRRKLGLRIDHILLSEPLAAQCRACSIDVAPRRLERPSDHAPVIADIEP